MTDDTVQDFEITLYFDGPPDLSHSALIEAWGREGYECQRMDERGVFNGLRGSTYVFVGEPRRVEAREIPDHYPLVTQPEIDWTKTFCVNPKAGYDDLYRATHRADFKMRVLTDEKQPEIAHNEIAATLLGIHQCAPMRAAVLHSIGMIVGRTDLDDYLNYANSHLDQPAQKATMLAFGAFVTQGEYGTRAWTTGLEHFSVMNLMIEDLQGDVTKALLSVFGLGNLVVHGRRFKAGEAITSFDLHARFEDSEMNGKPMLRVIRHV